MCLNLETSVQYLKGVGPKRKQLLNRLDINTIEDLIYYVPKDYDDRSQFKYLRECANGEKSSFCVEVTGPGIVLRPRRGMAILKVPISDGLDVGYMVWFNQEYLKYQFIPGQEYHIYGSKNQRGMEIQISNPDFEKKEESKKTGNIVPIYALTKGLTNTQLSTIIESALEEFGGEITEFLPDDLISYYGMMNRAKALQILHFPKNQDELIRARNRLVFEEFLVLQLGLYHIKNKTLDANKGISFKNRDLLNRFIKRLPFELTRAQKKVITEIQEDMESKNQMNRLVQGDVGSGKTIVALISMLQAIGSGYQVAMMAPTEILAKQHYESIKNFLEGFDIRVGLLIGSLKKAEKNLINEKLELGEIDIIVGTHAIIQEDVKIKNLGMVVTDEQHRFGVKQRNALSEKGKSPDVLVMTATPIPRTLALILYGDLDISIIDELPPGRKEIETYAVGMNMIEKTYDLIEKEIKKGRQTYIVCPLIEENEELSIVSVEELYKYLSEERFKNYKLGLLHGNMKAAEKSEIMRSFELGETDILVSTTVIEVGVDVPNSNLMVIYNAERFGLAQLHQLRGRVGRGEHQSYCILINDSSTKIARERMRIMQESSDGFVLSEKDLELRGPGEFFGTRQHGVPDLKIANIFQDMPVLKLAQKEANRIILEDPDLEMDKNLNLKKRIEDKFKEVEDISFN